LAGPKREFLMSQLVSISVQQAEKDYLMAEYYRRTGHPASAYFYYELVRRRYPGTKYADLSAKQMQEMRLLLDKAEGGPTELPTLPAPPKPGTTQPETAPAPRLLPSGVKG
jgi:hypothetical protein